MKGLIESGSILTYRVFSDYALGDIVFCHVQGRFIDAHRIADKREDGSYLIENNLGGINGWTNEVYGKVISIQPPDTTQTETKQQ